MSACLSMFAFIGGLGPTEMIVIGVIAVLRFGSRLPSVMRNLGRGFVEFKKGVRGIEDEIETAGTRSSRPRYDDFDDRDDATAPKFEPPPEASSESSSDESAAQQKA
jgi:sec-independent protein translocase protein TatA